MTKVPTGLRVEPGEGHRTGLYSARTQSLHSILLAPSSATALILTCLTWSQSSSIYSIQTQLENARLQATHLVELKRRNLLDSKAALFSSGTPPPRKKGSSAVKGHGTVDKPGS